MTIKQIAVEMKEKKNEFIEDLTGLYIEKSEKYKRHFEPDFEKCAKVFFFFFFGSNSWPSLKIEQMFLVKTAAVWTIVAKKDFIGNQRVMN